MSKYAELGEYLKKRRADRVPMSFAEIERITGVKLPPSARKHRPWWSNNPNNSVLTKIWLAAGYESEQVDMEAGKLVFRRVRAPEQPASRGGEEAPFHPLYGYMKGLVRVMPGTDLTQPADPELADYLDAKYGPENRKA
ncbi:MAG TPA: hypothetical protein VFB27_13430 [Opitutaceae bacterium]|nr:hypothetical protein [Opitutaceae bacterium]